MIKRLKYSKNILQSLGVQRETPEQQRRILLDIVSAFQEITQHSLAANYGVNDVFDKDKDSRLATLVSPRNGIFSDNLAHWLHTYTFRSKPQVLSLLIHGSEDYLCGYIKTPQASDCP